MLVLAAKKRSPIMGAFWFLEALGLLTHSDALPASEFRLPVRLRQTYRCWTQKFRSSWMKVKGGISDHMFGCFDTDSIVFHVQMLRHHWCKWRSACWKVCCKLLGAHHRYDMSNCSSITQGQYCEAQSWEMPRAPIGAEHVLTLDHPSGAFLGAFFRW